MNQRIYRFPGDRVPSGSTLDPSYGEEAQGAYVATVRHFLLEALEAFSALREPGPLLWTAEEFAGAFRVVERNLHAMVRDLDAAGLSPGHNWRVRGENRAGAFARSAQMMESQFHLGEVDTRLVLSQMGTRSRRKLAQVARLGQVLAESSQVGSAFEDWHRWAEVGVMVTLRGDPRGTGVFHALTPLGQVVGRHLLSQPEDLALQGLGAMTLGDLEDLRAHLVERTRASRQDEEFLTQDLTAVLEELSQRQQDGIRMLLSNPPEVPPEPPLPD